MSHIVEAVTSIVNPDRELLVQALELVARQYEQEEVERGIAEANRKTRLTTYYYDWTWRRIECGLGIVVPGLARGMGIVTGSQAQTQAQSGATETGQEQPLKFVGDFYDCESRAEQLQGQIVQTYISLATMQVLEQLGYRVEVAPVAVAVEGGQEAEASAQSASAGALQIRGVLYNV
jgi:hypothetical protein